MDEMSILSVNAHRDIVDHVPLAITTSTEGYALLLARTQQATYLVIVQLMGRTVSTIELASSRYAEFVIQLIDEQIRQHPGLRGEELNTHITLRAKNHLTRTPLPGDFLAPIA